MLLRKANMTDDEFAAWFWAKVNKDGPTQSHMESPCWEWTGARFVPAGYGQVYFKGRPYAAHRVAWVVTHTWPGPGMCVCHRCDHRTCVRPDHLWLGTSQENTADKMAKGRYRTAIREDHPMSKLTEVQVAEIRRLACQGEMTGRAIARQFGVSYATISLIKNYKIWSKEQHD